MPRDRTRLTNASIPRSVVLAAYENIAALLAVAETHREIARQAERLALAQWRWTLAHPESPGEVSVRELRRMITRQAMPTISPTG